MYPGGQIISGKGAIGGAGQVQKPFGEIFDKPSEGDFRKDFKGDSKGFLDNFKEGALGYFKDAQKGKSDTDKLLDFARETRGMGSGAQFGGMGSGFSTEVAEGLNVYNPPSTQQMFIPGQEGKPGLFSVGGAIRGGIGGFMKGGPAGALGGAAMGGFM